MRAIVTTLLKIITNITQNPMEPKFRKLPKHSKSMQEKILKYPYAVHFLVAVGFVDEGENWSLNGFDKDRLLQAEKALCLLLSLMKMADIFEHIFFFALFSA